jgi:hypothetical protein
MKQFGDKNRKAAREEDHPITIKMLDREVTVHSPGAEQLAYLSAMLLEDELDAAGGLINFFAELLETDGDRRYLKKILLDHSSGFDVYDLADMAEYLVEEWGKRPTTAASGSSPTQRTTGKSSTASSRRVRAKTPSTSASTGS